MPLPLSFCQGLFLLVFVVGFCSCVCGGGGFLLNLNKQYFYFQVLLKDIFRLSGTTMSLKG